MSSICLLTLCGLPAAGKTTFVQSFSDSLARQKCDRKDCCTTDSQEHVKYHVVLVVYDDILPAVLSNSASNAISEWKLHRLAINKCLDRCLARLLSLNYDDSETETALDTTMARVSQHFLKLIRGLDEMDTRRQHAVFLLDDNMYYASMRYEIYQLARKYSTGYAQLYFNANLSRVIARNKERSCPVPDDIISSMAERFDIPSSHNSWENRTVTWTDEDYTSDNFLKVIEVIEDAMRNPVQRIVEDNNESRIVCSTNVIHQSDCILRHLVTEYINKIKVGLPDKRLLQVQAKRANQVRQSILQDMRNDQLLVPQSVADSIQACSNVDSSDNTDKNLLYDFVKTVFLQNVLDSV